MSGVDSGADDEDFSYRLRDEALPDAPIYNPELQSLLRDTKENLQSLHRTMESCPLASVPQSNIYSLSQDTHQLAQFEQGNTRTVGFVGNSGVGKFLVLFIDNRDLLILLQGKSSLINSLLDVGNLARSVRIAMSLLSTSIIV
jgi:hypothetical protein